MASDPTRSQDTEKHGKKAGEVPNLQTELLLEIARCPIALRCLAGEQSLPCSTIVLSQQAEDLSQFQSPEPWSGHLSLTPLLFLSSNPSIAPTALDEYPRMTWNDESTIEYFNERFGDQPMSSVQHGIYDALPGANRARHGTKYWIGIRSRAAELLGVATSEVRPGIDYALTEVVRCKSTKEVGVAEALSTCVDRYLESTLQVAAASTLIVIGAPAKRSFCHHFKIHEVTRWVGPILVGGRNRFVLFLPHPASFNAKKTVRGCLDEQEYAKLREWIVAES